MDKMIKCKKRLVIRINNHSTIHIEYLGKYNDIKICNMYDSNQNYVTCIYTKFQYLEFNFSDDNFICYTIKDKIR